MEPPALDELAHGRALAAGQDEPGDAVEVGGFAHANAVHADGAERIEVLAECPLEGKHTDLHGRDARGVVGRPPTSP